MQYPSKLIENAVAEISKLPGIGKKTALRLALHLLKENEKTTFLLSEALTKLRKDTLYCTKCHNISDAATCNICLSPKRDKSVLCVVEDTQDVLALENTAQFNGQYFVLGGIISPINGIGPSDLKIDHLVERIKNEEISEIILALSPNIDGDTTSFYISKLLKNIPVKITTIARGIPVGSELEYMDEITLGRSIQRRISFEME